MINNYHFPCEVSKNYCPEGKSLLSISVIEDKGYQGKKLVDLVSEEYCLLTGTPENALEHLHTYRIPQALPQVDQIDNDMSPTATKILDNVYLAGDYLLNASLNAAMKSGRLAAEAVMGEQYN